MGGQIRRGRIWRFWVARFSVQRSQIPIFKGFWGLWTENRGAPKTPNSTTTDLTPHLRPSEENRSRDTWCTQEWIFVKETPFPEDLVTLLLPCPSRCSFWILKMSFTEAKVPYRANTACSVDSTAGVPESLHGPFCMHHIHHPILLFLPPRTHFYTNLLPASPPQSFVHPQPYNRMQLFRLQLEASCLQWSSFTYI